MDTILSCGIWALVNSDLPLPEKEHGTSALSPLQAALFQGGEAQAGAGAGPVTPSPRGAAPFPGLL